MTWDFGGRLGVVAVVLAVATTGSLGCGSSGKEATISIESPKKGAQLTNNDDVDADKPGLQYDVTATATDVAEGTVVFLTIDGESDVTRGSVASDGSILFDNVTLPPGSHTLKVSTANDGVHSADDYGYVYKTLSIDSPREGAALGPADDKDPALDGIQITVSATSYAIETTENLSVVLDGQTVGNPAHVDTRGKVVFNGVTLAPGSHTLRVVAGAVQSDVVHVSVMDVCAHVDFVSPMAPTGADRLVLGGGDACPSGQGDTFKLDVVVATDAGEGRDVELKVNGTTVGSAKVSHALARFSNVTLNRFSSANQLAAVVQGAQGITCKEVRFPVDVYVDCEGSDCSIGSPDPQPGTDATGARVLYLNKSKLAAKDFDIRVDTDPSALGKKVKLIIDGADRDALTADPIDADSKVSATFAAVALAQGQHTFEAKCEDSAGNITYSGKATWTVDTNPCSLQITEPTPDVLFLSPDDVDTQRAGTQVELTSTVGGTDCADTRTHVCDLSAGIDASVGFDTYDGNATLKSPVTLQDQAQQTLCVEVRDHAGNLARDGVPVRYRSNAPKVQIEAPADASSFNALGTNGHTADSDPSSPTICNANFDILCSELGAAVDLHRTDEASAVFATGNCVKESNVPAGYVGRAHLANVAFLPTNATMATIVATQTVQSSSGRKLLGSSAVAISGVCAIPSIDFFPSCPPAQMALPVGGADVSAGTVQAAYMGTTLSRAPASATLTVTGSTSGRIGSDYVSALMTDRYRFTNVNLGHAPETVTIQLTATDDTGNVVQRSCMTDLVMDLPDLNVTSPANAAVFGPGQGCSSGVARKYGVPVQLTVDKTIQRTLSYTIGSGSAVMVPITGQSMNVCVPADEGPNTITFRLGSTLGIGYDSVPVSVTVRSILLSMPPSGATLTAANDYCDPGFGAHIVGSTDLIYAGASVTASNGATSVSTTVTSGGVIDTCLPLAEGPNTLTVSIDGTTASTTMSAVVITTPPSHAVPITTVTLPAGGQYRTGSVHLAWAAPTEDWPGQIQNYELRCANTPVLASDATGTKDSWWNAADQVALASNQGKPPSIGADVDFRIGETRNCVLRGQDVSLQLTPIPDSKSIDYAFRVQPVDTSDINKMGNTLARIGDVNGDGVNDILVGGANRAYLYFGNAMGLGAKATPGAPDVTFIANSATANYEFGSRTAGIGDFNRDGRNDFAIGFPAFNSLRGAVYVFYGRTSADPWPANVDLTGACAADVCFVGEQATELLGYALSPAGDFDGDGSSDLAFSAVGRDVGPDTLAGRLYVLLSHAYEGSGTRSGSFWGTQVGIPSADPIGFYIDGTGYGSADDLQNSSQFGQAIAAVGNVDGAAGADIVLSAAGKSNPAVTAKLFFLSGRTHDGSAPKLRSLTYSDALLKDTGPANNFALRLTSYRNWMDTTESNIPDVVASVPTRDSFYLYLGDRNPSSVRFAADTKISVNGETTTQFGNAIAATYNPNLSDVSFGDLDGDGLDELLVGTKQATANTSPGFAYMFYGDVALAKTSSKTLSYTNASRVDTTARAGTLRRVVAYVGDVTGDGALDLVVADPEGSSNAGGFAILY